MQTRIAARLCSCRSPPRVACAGLNYTAFAFSHLPTSPFRPRYGLRRPAPAEVCLTRSIGPDDGREAPEGPDDLPPLVRFEVLDLDQFEEPHVAKARKGAGEAEGRRAPTREPGATSAAHSETPPDPVLLKARFPQGRAPENLARARRYILNPQTRERSLGRRLSHASFEIPEIDWLFLSRGVG